MVNEFNVIFFNISVLSFTFKWVSIKIIVGIYMYFKILWIGKINFIVFNNFLRLNYI